MNELKEFFHKLHLFFLFIFINGVLIDIFIVKANYDLFLMILVFFWMGFIIGSGWESRFSIFGSILLLLICCFFSILKLDPLADKAAVWAYLLLAVGVGQKLLEDKGLLENQQDFIKKIKLLIKKTENRGGATYD